MKLVYRWNNIDEVIYKPVIEFLEDIDRECRDKARFEKEADERRKRWASE